MSNVTVSETNGDCRGHLDHISNPPNITFHYHPTTEPQVGSINGSSFFKNDDPASCPITKCSLRQPDCKSIYDEGIFISQKSPFEVTGVTNFEHGWDDPICLVCENKDEEVGVHFFLSQEDCNKTNNCPKAKNVTNTVPPGACKGHLDHLLTPPNISFNYTTNDKPQESIYTASDYFVISDP